jgi:hypothetical protein
MHSFLSTIFLFMKMRICFLVVILTAVITHELARSATGAAKFIGPITATRSTSVPATPAKSPCRLIPGDEKWPLDDIWKKEIPGVTKVSKPDGNITRPDWLVNAKGPADIQNAVKFAAKHNIRLTIYNSGHDFLGRLVHVCEIEWNWMLRNDAPNGLWLNVQNIKGCHAHEEYKATETGMPPVNYTNGQYAAFTLHFKLTIKIARMEQTSSNQVHRNKQPILWVRE